MSRVHKPQKLPQVLSVEEVERLLAGASNPKHRAALAVVYGAGLRASEVVHLKIADIEMYRILFFTFMIQANLRPREKGVKIIFSRPLEVYLLFDLD